MINQSLVHHFTSYLLLMLIDHLESNLTSCKASSTWGCLNRCFITMPAVDKCYSVSEVVHSEWTADAKWAWRCFSKTTHRCEWLSCVCSVKANVCGLNVNVVCALIFASPASSGKNMLKAAGMEAAVSIRKRNVFTQALKMSHKTL